MANFTCYGNSGCLHIGKDASWFGRGGMCITKPVDAANYPGASGKVYAGVNCRGSSGNLRILENGIEIHRYNTGNDDYAWTALEWSDGYHCEDIEFAFYNGNTKRWSRKTSVGDGPIISLLDISIPTSITVGDPLPISFVVANTGSLDMRVTQWGIAVDDQFRAGSYGGREWTDILCGKDMDFCRKYYTKSAELGEWISRPGDHQISLVVVSASEGVVARHDVVLTALPSPCAGIVCNPVSVGPYMYSQKCVNGVCVQDELIPCNIIDDAPAGYACVDGEWVEEPNPRTPPCGSYGDIDGDGVVSYNDLAMCAKYLGGQITLTPEQLLRADVTGTGKITILNLMLINNYLYEHIDTFPVCANVCEGIVCENACIGADLYSQKCVNGVCVTDALIEANSAQCGYVPPAPCTSTLLGDVNGDGVVDQADADLLFHWVAAPNLRETTYRLACPENANVTGSGNIHIGDAALLQNHVLFPDDPAFAFGPEPQVPAQGVITYVTIPVSLEPGAKFSVEVGHTNIGGSKGWFKTSIAKDGGFPGSSASDVDAGSSGSYHALNYVMPDHDSEVVTVLYVDGVEADRQTHTVIMVPPPPTPECTLTDADYFTCPNGSVIQLNECVNGVKMPIIPIPTCPTPPSLPQVPGGAVMPPGAVGGMISDSGYVYAILLEHWDQHFAWNGNVGLTRYEMYCYPNDTEWTTNEWGRMIAPITVTDRHVYSPIAPDDTHSFTFISKFNGKTYHVNGIIIPGGLGIQGGVNWGWEPEVVPPPPPECTLTDADYFTCPDGSTIQLNECVNGVKMPIIPIPTCPPLAPPPPPQLCTEGEERSPLTCWDGTPIMTEVCVKDEFGGTAWLPSGEVCPMQAITRVMDMAIPAIMYEGQVVDIVVQVFCGAAASTNEPTTLQVDGMAVQTKNTLAGNVTFRWTAKGVGMHKVCAVIPINPGCAVPGTICKTITVSANVEGIMDQIKTEKAAYESQLEYLRGLKKQLKARPTYGAIPGVVFVPPSFAGRIVDVGGIIRTVPPGGISIPVPPGSNIITIIGDAGERINVPVTVDPGLTVTLPTIPGLPGLPGGF